jgi:hypothetical protein
VIANIATVLEAARSADAPVFHTRIVVPPAAGLGGVTAPILRMLAPDTFETGSWGAEPVDPMTEEARRAEAAAAAQPRRPGDRLPHELHRAARVPATGTEPASREAMLRRRLGFLEQSGSFFHDGDQPLWEKDMTDPYRRGCS